MSTRNLFFPAVTVLLLSSGCINSMDGIDESSPMEIGALPSKPTDGGTWSGGNGEWPPDRTAMLPYMPAAMGISLADPKDPDTINPSILSLGFADTDAGKEVFTYMVRCALSGDIKHPSGTVYHGEGILVGTDHWRTGPLSPSVQNRVHACLMAFLNGFDEEVNIAIVSPLEVATSDDISEYFITEAAWMATGSESLHQYMAFLSDDFYSTCPEPVPTFNMRICATSEGDCGITTGEWDGNCTTDLDGVVHCTAPDGTVGTALVTKLAYCPY